MLFAYTFRNLVARRISTLSTASAIAAAVAATTVMLALVEGLSAAILEGGVAENVMILSRGAASPLDSHIGPEMASKMKILPHIAKSSGSDLLSFEFLTELQFRRPDGRIEGCVVRGVDPIALEVHQKTHLAAGVLPEHTAPGVVIGRKLVGQFEGFQLGESVRIGRSKWPVVGILAAGGTRFESEVWADRSALESQLHREGAISAAWATLPSTAEQPAFAAAVDRDLGPQLYAASESDYYRQTLAEISVYLRVVEAVILMLGLGAMFAGANAMYSSFLGRTRELATLIAIGYTRSRVISILLLESLLLSTAGGALGLAIALFANGRSVRFEQLELIYSVHVTPRVLVAGVIVAAMIGLLSGVASSLQALRFHVLTALREP